MIQFFLLILIFLRIIMHSHHINCLIATIMGWVYMTFAYSHRDHSTEITLSKITKNYIYESLLFTLILTFLHLHHYIILVKNDVDVQLSHLKTKWEVCAYIFVPLSLVYLRLSLKILRKKYFCRSFRNLITPNFDFVPTGNISDSWIECHRVL